MRAIVELAEMLPPTCGFRKADDQLEPSGVGAQRTFQRARCGECSTGENTGRVHTPTSGVYGKPSRPASDLNLIHIAKGTGQRREDQICWPWQERSPLQSPTTYSVRAHLVAVTYDEKLAGKSGFRRNRDGGGIETAAK